MYSYIPVVLDCKSFSLYQWIHGSYTSGITITYRCLIYYVSPGAMLSIYLLLLHRQCLLIIPGGGDYGDLQREHNVQLAVYK